jgi:hypothetical protein
VSKCGFKEEWHDEIRKQPEFTTGENRKKFPYDLLVQMVLKSFNRLKVPPAINWSGVKFYVFFLLLLMRGLRISWGRHAEMLNS